MPVFLSAFATELYTKCSIPFSLAMSAMSFPLRVLPSVPSSNGVPIRNTDSTSFTACANESGSSRSPLTILAPSFLKSWAEED
jgi:hypothetical protein